MFVFHFLIFFHLYFFDLAFPIPPCLSHPSTTPSRSLSSLESSRANSAAHNQTPLQSASNRTEQLSDPVHRDETRRARPGAHSPLHTRLLASSTADTTPASTSIASSFRLPSNTNPALPQISDPSALISANSLADVLNLVQDEDIPLAISRRFILDFPLVNCCPLASAPTVRRHPKLSPFIDAWPHSHLLFLPGQPRAVKRRRSFRPLTLLSRAHPRPRHPRFQPSDNHHLSRLLRNPPPPPCPRVEYGGAARPLHFLLLRLSHLNRPRLPHLNRPLCLAQGCLSPG